MLHLSISVGTHTFKHEDGNNNFVQRNDPLGWHIGSDSRERKVGLNWFYQNKVLTSINMGIRNIGENNFINNLYGAYIDYLEGHSQAEMLKILTFYRLSLNGG